MAAESVRLTAKVSGQVQGVGYRIYAVRLAHKYGLSGYVRNLSDGGVEVQSEGPRETQLLFLQGLQRGPWGSRVGEVDCRWGRAQGEWPAFEVRY